MSGFLVIVTAAVALLVLFVMLPELSERGCLLRRWSRDTYGAAGNVTDSITTEHLSRFIREHGLTESETRPLQNMRTRPAMMPVTLLLHPYLVRRKGRRFVRSGRQNLLIGALVTIALIFPPVTGMAVEHPAMWLGSVINIAAFAAGANLVRQCMSDTSLVNLLLTGKGD
ncbi:hypothetical protein OMR58_22190 [Erwinia sp. INIA-01]|uniref:hypothetical protein n=1 Tax=Erwinia sp. INIA01 TaxID=2991500 RepID=UPI00222501CD|nr:hypothetical protein [Erwinia sp. INIA01]MCW1877161.1 hypothetical protein [Erwinia sp. INIA01]